MSLWVLLLVFSNLFLGTFSRAATLTWTGAASDGNVNTAGNWNPAAVPKTGDQLVFAGSISLNPQESVNLSLASITFGTTASTFTLGGAGVYTLTGGTGIVNSSTATQTINNAITLGANQVWKATSGNLVFGGNINTAGNKLTIDGAFGTTINSIISGTGGMEKKGTGTLTLNGNNTFSGTFTLSGGKLAIGSNAALGTGTVAIKANTSIQAVNGARTLTNAVRLEGPFAFTGTNALTFTGGTSLINNATITSNSAALLTFDGVISGGKNLTKAGTGTVVLNGANTYTGDTILSAGTLVVGTNTAAGGGKLLLGNATIQTGGGDRTLSNVVTIQGNTTFSGANNFTFTGATNLGNTTRTLTITNPMTTFSGIIDGGAGKGITKSGSGTLMLSGTAANKFDGPVSVNDGTLIFNKTDGVAAMAGKVLTIGDSVGAANSAVLQLNASNQIKEAEVAVTINTDGLFNLQGFTEDIGKLTMTGGIIAGTSSSRLDLIGTTANTTVTVSTSGSNVALITANLALNNNRTFTVNDNAVSTDNDLSISGNITNGTVSPSSLTKTGAGTLLLSGANAYSGGTNILNGRVIIDSNTALGTSTVNLGDTTGANGASLLFSTTSGRTITNAIIARAGSSGTLTLGGLNTSGVNTYSGSVTLNKSATLIAAAGGEVLFSNVISGVGDVTKIGAGTVRYGAANTYTGLTTITAGTLAYGVDNAIATGGVTINGATAVLDLGANHTDTVGQVILDNGGTITGSGSSTLSSTTPAFDLRNGSVTIALGGNSALTKTTAGTVTLSGNNTYTGVTTVSAGILQLGVANSLPSGTAVTVAGGATLAFGGFNQTIGSLAGAGTVTLGAATVTTGGNNTSTTFSGVLTGSGGVTKNGIGVFTVSGTNLSTGATTINAGEFELGSTTGINSVSAVTVASGATFDLNNFSATIGSLAGAGSVTLGSGTLTTGGNNTSTTFSGVISGTGGLTKDGNGTFILSGANTFSGSVLINGGGLTLSGASGSAVNASGFTLDAGTTLTLDNSAGDANRIGDSAAITLKGGTLQFISDGNGSTETVGALRATGGASRIMVDHNGSVTDATSLTFSSLGTISPGATVDFSSIGGGALGVAPTGPHIFISGQTLGLMGSWATVGNDFAEYTAFGVRAYSAYYKGPLGVNINDPTKIVWLDSASPVGAWTLTNAGTTTDLGLKITDLATVDLGTSSSNVLNLTGGGLIKGTDAVITDTTISGAGRLTAGGTTNGTLSITVEAGNSLTISSIIINNAGLNGIYGDAGDGVVALAKGGAGLLVLSGANTFTGNVFVNAGILQISSESNLGATDNDVIFGGGTLRVTTGFSASTATTFTITSDLSGTLDILSGQTLTLGNANDMLLTGNTASVLHKTGAGVFVIQAANASFDGMMQIDEGTVELRHAQSLGDSVNRGKIILNSGTLGLRNDASTNFANDVTVTADSTIDAARLSGTTPAVTHTLGALSIGANALTFSGSNGAAIAFGAVTLTGNATFNPTTADATLGAVSGSFGFTKTGACALILNGASSYTGATAINVGTLRLGAAGGVSSASAVTVASGATFDLNNFSATIGSLAGAGGVTLGSGTLTTGGNNSSTTFSGIASGSGGLTKIGDGIFTLSGSNVFTGATTINAGTLRLGVANSLPSTSAVTIASGATFDLNNFNSTIGSLAGAGDVTLGSGTLTTGGDNTSTIYSGILSGSGGLTKSGSGAFTLSGASTYTGVTNVNGGVLIVQNSDALGSVSGGTVVASGAELRMASGTSVGAESLTLNGTGISGAGALRIISGTASWSGGITLASAASIGADAGQLTLGGTINLGANALTFTGAGVTQSDGIISGSGSLVKNDTGTLTLAGANTYTGVTTINAGAVNVQNGLAFGANGAGAVTVMSGATVRFNSIDGISVGNKSIILNGNGISGGGAIDSVLGNNSWAGSVTLASEATIAVDADSLTITGAIGESGGTRALLKTGLGTLVVGGENTYSGATWIKAGTLQIASSERIVDNSAVIVDGGATLDLNFVQETIGSLSGAGAVTFGTVADPAEAVASLTTGGDGTSTTFSGVLSGNGDFTKTGSGTQTLSGANTFIGTVFLNGGVLSIDANSRLGAATNTLDFGGGILRLTSAMTSDRAVKLSVGGTIDTSGVNSTLSGNIIGEGSLTKIGAGTLTLSGINSYTGATMVTSGTLKAGVASVTNVSGAFGLNSAVTLANSTGVSLDITGFNTQIGSLAGGGTTGGNVTLGNATLTVGGDNTDTSYAGVISGTGGNLTKVGTGMQILTGTNTYAGDTIVNGGTLQIDGVLASAVAVNSGATLSGSGSVSKAITINGVGALRPGNKTPTGSGLGTFTLSGTGNAGNLTVGNNGILDLQLGANGIAFANQSTTYYTSPGVLNAAYTVPGNQVVGANDRIVVGGTLALTDTSVIDVTLNGYTPSLGDGFNVLDWTTLNLGGFAIGPNIRTGTIADNNLYDLKLPDLTALGYSWDVSLFRDHGIIVVVVPEPSRVILLMAGLASCLLRRRRHLTV